MSRESHRSTPSSGSKPEQKHQPSLIPDLSDKTPPQFDELLREPAVSLPLPSDFVVEQEAAHLTALWQRNDKIRFYSFDQFIHAGGSGLVFRVSDSDTGATWALKIARKKIFEPDTKGKTNVPPPSPFSKEEVSALRQVSHPNLVRLHDQIVGPEGTLGLVTTYVEKPRPIDEYLRETLSKDPDPHRKKGVTPFSPRRLDNACEFLVVTRH